MKIVIETPSDSEEDKIILRCRNLDENLLALISNLKMHENMLVGYIDENIHRIHPSEVFYFESVDNKTFIYCQKNVYESKQKLYQLEEQFSHSDFFRSSKSVIVNLTKIKALTPAFSGRLEALLENGEKVIISRQYVADLRKKLKI